MNIRVLLMVLAAFALALAGLAWGQTTVVGKDVVLTASDGVLIHGTYYGAGRKAPAVILLHMMRRNRTDWEDFTLDLKEKGFASLSIDLRGHGQSTSTKDGKALNLKDFSNNDFRAITRDVEAAMRYLRKQSVDKNRIGIVGASIGANVGLTYAADHPDEVKAVALLSPGLNYRNVGTEAPMTKFAGPVFLTAGKGDDYSAQSVLQLARIKPQRCATHIFPGGKHGTNLFLSRKDLSLTLVDWLMEHLK